MELAMNHDLRDKTPDDVTTSTVSDGHSSIPVAKAMSAGRVASRRYILLKGVGRGSAILAAAVPIKTLASVPSVTITGEICSVSGTQSVVHSQPKGLPPCAGSRPAKYATLANWPTGRPYTVNGKSIDQNTPFNSVFGAGSSLGMFAILNRPVSDESHWIAALLNAIKAPASPVFPYTAPEVLGLYGDVTKRAAALAFFTNFMETLT
jgi:hypothetical protein